MIDLLHLGLLALLNHPRAIHLDQRLPERNSDGQRTARMGNPNAIKQIKLLNMLGKSLRDNERHVSAAATLVVAELSKPAVAPGLGTLCFPKDDARRLPHRTVDLLDNVRAQLPLPHRLNEIGRETTTQKLFELKLKDFALRLLRALLSLTFQFFDGAGHGIDGLILF